MDTFLLLFFLSFSQAFGLRCFDCDSTKHPGVCNDQGNLTEQHTNHIEEDCRGSCIVGTLWNNKEEVHLRNCLQSNNQNGCEKIENGFICQCSTDLCNRNLSTCHKISRCLQTIHYRQDAITEKAMSATIDPLDTLNRSIITFGAITGCLVGVVAILMVIFIVHKIRKGRSRGIAFHPVRTTLTLHAVTTYRRKASSNDVSNLLDGHKSAPQKNGTVRNDNALPPTYDTVMAQNSLQTNNEEVKDTNRSPPNSDIVSE